MRRQRGERDWHYVFINYASMLAANHILFNSHFHRNSLLTALPKYLKQYPEYNEMDSVESFLAHPANLMFVGHTHLPAKFAFNDQINQVFIKCSIGMEKFYT